MTGITESENKFGFVVRPEANKLQIKAEIEATYGVTVVGISTMNYACLLYTSDAADEQ